MTKIDNNRLRPVAPGTVLAIDGMAISGPVYDVTHPDFGALGDGQTNDTVAVNRAYLRAAVAGGLVYFPGPKRTYVCTLGVYASNVWVIGAGSGIVTLKRPASVLDDKNVIEFNQTALGAGAPAMDRCGIVGLTIDGNKANVPAPPNAGADVTNHGVIFTNVQHPFVRDLKAQNCWNSGIDAVIACDYFDIDDVFVTGCSNTITGVAGFEINSSRSGNARATIQNCVYGVRLLDNIHGCDFDFTIRQTNRHGLILDNQSVNISWGNRVRAEIHEAGTDGVGAAFYHGRNWDGNSVDVVVAFAGCSFEANVLTAIQPTPGVLFGQLGAASADQPEGNRVKLQIFKCGGTGFLCYATQVNEIDIVATENGQQAALGYYAVDSNGNNQNLDVTCRDSAAKQRGIVHRVGATGNKVRVRAANPTSPYDDNSTNFTNHVERPRRGVRLVATTSGNTALTVADPDTIRFTAALTGGASATIDLTGAIKGDRWRVIRANAGGAFTLTVQDGSSNIVKVIPASTAAAVEAEFDGTNLVLRDYSLL